MIYRLFRIRFKLDYKKGGTLKQLIKQEGSLKFSQVKSIMRKIFIAVNQIHQNGIIHRDLTPSNILFDKVPLKNKDITNIDISIADFGLSVQQKFIRIAQKKCGTPGFIAPEVLNDMPYSLKSDVFSIGCLFYLLLTGKHLFKGNDAMEVLKQNKICMIYSQLNESKVVTRPLLRELLIKFLNPHPEQRISCEDALNHPIFVENYQIKSREQNCQTLKNLKVEDKFENFKDFLAIQNMEYRKSSNQKLVSQTITMKHNNFQKERSYSFNQSNKSNNQIDQSFHINGYSQVSNFSHLSQNIVQSNQFLQQYNKVQVGAQSKLLINISQQQQQNTSTIQQPKSNTAKPRIKHIQLDNLDCDSKNLIQVSVQGVNKETNPNLKSIYQVQKDQQLDNSEVIQLQKKSLIIESEANLKTKSNKNLKKQTISNRLLTNQQRVRTTNKFEDHFGFKGFGEAQDVLVEEGLQEKQLSFIQLKGVVLKFIVKQYIKL
eukprot:403332852